MVGKKTKTKKGGISAYVSGAKRRGNLRERKFYRRLMEASEAEKKNRRRTFFSAVKPGSGLGRKPGGSSSGLLRTRFWMPPSSEDGGQKKKGKMQEG